jgi:hypothetical protein
MVDSDKDLGKGVGRGNTERERERQDIWRRLLMRRNTEGGPTSHVNTSHYQRSSAAIMEHFCT